MEKTNKIEVFILGEDGKTLHAIEEWEKQEDPTAAKSVVIRNEFGQMLELDKEALPGEMKFQDALDAAAAQGGTTGTRKQWIDVYEAIHTAGLNEALELIGGDTIDLMWYWTCEKDSDQSNAYNAWIFSGNSGTVPYNNARINAYASRVFRAFRPDLNL